VLLEDIWVVLFLFLARPRDFGTPK